MISLYVATYHSWVHTKGLYSTYLYKEGSYLVLRAYKASYMLRAIEPSQKQLSGYC